MSLAVVLCLSGLLPYVYSHCQIPCAIYDDPARLQEIGEHITTIEKAMKQIQSLTQGQPSNYNQLVRWVNNKEQHADELSEIVTYYFMTQRLKPVAADASGDKEYVQELTMLHEMLVASMKCKQTTDLSYVERLRTLLRDFSVAYEK